MRRKSVQEESSSDDSEDSLTAKVNRAKDNSTICSDEMRAAPQLRTIRFLINGGTVDTKIPSGTTLFQIRQRVKRRFDGNYQVGSLFLLPLP